MSVYKFHMLSFERWAERIGGDRSKSAYWKRIFEDHPEFFRLDRERKLASLVWRRQNPKRFHVDRGLLSVAECNALTPAEKEQSIAERLSDSDVKTLIDTAINLHARAVELQRESRWWVLLARAVGGIIGAILGTLFK